MIFTTKPFITKVCHNSFWVEFWISKILTYSKQYHPVPPQVCRVCFFWCASESPSKCKEIWHINFVDPFLNRTKTGLHIIKNASILFGDCIQLVGWSLSHQRSGMMYLQSSDVSCLRCTNESKTLSACP
jgi:hypothetical protein